MKMLIANRKFSLLFLPFLLTSFIFVGCGEDNNPVGEDNAAPVIAAITNQMVDVEDEITVEVSIAGADADDTHTLSASADDTAIATASLNEATLTLIGGAEGTTTITVSATDDSGKRNAAATPLEPV